MVNLLFYIIIGATFAFFQPFAEMFLTGQNSYGNIVTVFNVFWLIWGIGSFLFGMFLASVVRFIPPKRVHVITFLGTTPMQLLKTGVRMTLPWPFGWTHRVVPTDIQDMPIRGQVKPKDNLVYELPANAQWFAHDAMLYAIERDNPKGQLENLLTAAIRNAASQLTLFEVYSDKDKIQQLSLAAVQAELASFGVTIKELVVQDPRLPETTATRLSAIREAELDQEAAVFEAEALFTRMVGGARAEAESTRLKGSALANFRLLIAEGNAGAIAVMQGKLGIKWVDETLGEGEAAVKIRTAKFVTPVANDGEAVIPEIDIAPETVLEFFKVVDGNDAIRDAASKPGTTVVLSTGSGNGQQMGLPAALLDKLSNLKEHQTKETQE